MNMPMVTPQVAATAAPAGNAGTQAASKAAGTGGNTSANANANGFAGALVQAIVGNANGGTAQNATQPSLLTADVASLLGQAQTQQGDAATGTDLVAMLGKLLEQLQAATKDDTASDDAATNPLDQLLASLQDLLNQLNLVQLPTLGSEDMSSLTSDLSLTGGSQTATLATLMPVLLQALKQASQTPGQLEQLSQPIGDFVQKMQQAISSVSGSAKAADAAPTVQTAAGDAQTATSLQLLGAANQQATVVVSAAEPRKTTAAFKEPIVHWNLVSDASTSDQPSDVPVVTAASNTQQSSDQPMPFGLTVPQSQPQTVASASEATLPAQVPVQQFTQQVGNYLVKQFTLSGGNGVATAKLTLHPDNLGQVDIRIAMQDGQLTAQFVAHNGTAKELLENQMGMLRTALQGQGIQVEKMDVVQQSDLTGSTSFLGQERGNSESGQGGRQTSKRERDGMFEEPVNFEAEMERTSVLRDAGYGSSINVTA